MSEQPEYRCPKCGGTRFLVDVVQVAEVDFLPGEEHEIIEVGSNDVEWTPGSPACCALCGDYDALETFATAARTEGLGV